MLFHYSEDPRITRFEPRPSRKIKGRPAGERLVWAIDGHHSPAYYFPRECPRIVLWPVVGSTQEDIERWMERSGARMVAHIELAWAQRFEKCELFRYSFEPEGFEPLNDHGVHVSRSTMTPMEVTPVGDLASALNAANVELRVVESLQPLADASSSTLHYSGIRLRNANGWEAAWL